MVKGTHRLVSRIKILCIQLYETLINLKTLKLHGIVLVSGSNNCANCDFLLTPPQKQHVRIEVCKVWAGLQQRILGDFISLKEG